MTSSAPPPLAGVRVLDLSRLLPGAFATSLLARLGAGVLKVEPPGGDDPLLAIERAMGGSGEFVESLLDGKRRLALDLNSADGREILLKLVERADVLIESQRAENAQRQDPSHQELARRHPGLVHCLLTAGGSQGGLAGWGGHDLNLLAMAGVLSLLRPAEGPPVVPGVQIGGLGASSLPAVQAILAALLARAGHGRGCLITVSMVHNLQSWMGLERSVAQAAAGDGEARQPSLLRGRLPCYSTYETADGRHLALGAAQPRLWQAFCAAVERPAWVARQYDPELTAEVRELFAARPLADWRQLAGGLGSCIEPVLEADEAAALLERTGRPAAGEELLPGVWFDGEAVGATAMPAAAPAPAEHTAEVLAELGLRAAEIEALAARGVIALGEVPAVQPPTPPPTGVVRDA